MYGFSSYFAAMNRPILQKHFSQHQNAEEAHTQNTLRWVQVIQGLVISSHFCVSQGKSLVIRAGVTPRRGFGNELNIH